jgi:hypothetical protein
MFVDLGQSRPGAAEQLTRSHLTASWVLALVAASGMALVSVFDEPRNATAADRIVTSGMEHFASTDRADAGLRDDRPSPPGACR